MALSEFLEHRVSFVHPVATPDGQGGETIVEVPVYTNIPASVQPMKAFQQYIYAAQNIRTEQAVFTDRDLSLLQNGDYCYFKTIRYVITSIRDVENDERVWEVLIYRYRDKPLAMAMAAGPARVNAPDAVGGFIP